MDIALGLDGYTLLFFMHDRHIFGQEVLKDIYFFFFVFDFFFHTTKLLLKKKKKPLKEVIATIITLVAMVPNPKRMGGLEGYGLLNLLYNIQM